MPLNRQKVSHFINVQLYFKILLRSVTISLGGGIEALSIYLSSIAYLCSHHCPLTAEGKILSVAYGRELIALAEVF